VLKARLRAAEGFLVFEDFVVGFVVGFLVVVLLVVGFLVFFGFGVVVVVVVVSGKSVGSLTYRMCCLQPAV
jgi:hypothetical protein